MKLANVLVITLGLAACSKGGLGEATDKLDAFKTKICACKDKACLDRVRKDRDEWMRKFEEEGKSKPDKGKEPSESELKRIEAIGNETRACEEKLEQADDKAGAEAKAAKVTGFADQVCACKDIACADAVMADMSKWSESAKQADRVSDVKLDEPTAKKITDATNRLTECYAKLTNKP